MTSQIFAARLSLTKSALETGRDAMVFALLIAAMVIPKPVGEHLAKMGFTKVTTPLGDIDVGAMLDTTKAIATSVSESNQSILTLRAQLWDRRQAMPADKRGMVDSTIRMLDSTASRLGRADSSVTAALLEQQTALAQAGIKPAPSAGWVRMGPQVFGAVAADTLLRPGDSAVVKGTVLLRSDASGSQRWRSPVLGVLPAGTRVTVDSVEGGWVRVLVPRR